MSGQTSTIDPDILSAYGSGAPQTAGAQPLVTDDLRAAYNSADPTKATPGTPQQMAVARAMGHPDLGAQFNDQINNFKPGPVPVVGGELLKLGATGLGAVNQKIEGGEAQVANAFNNFPIPRDQAANIKNMEFGDVATAKGESPFNAAVQGTVAAGVLNPLNAAGKAGEALGDATKAAAVGTGNILNATRRGFLTLAHTIGGRNPAEINEILNTAYANTGKDITGAGIPALGQLADKSQKLLTSLGNMKNQIYQATKATTQQEIAQPQHVSHILNGVSAVGEGENPHMISNMMNEPIGMQDAPTINKDGSSTTTLYRHDDTAGGLVPYKQIVRTKNAATQGDTTTLANQADTVDPSGVTTHSSQTAGSTVAGGVPNKIPYTVGNLFNDMTSGHLPSAQELNLAKQALNGHAALGTPQSAVAGKMADVIDDALKGKSGLPPVSPSLAHADAVNVQYSRAKDAMQRMFGDVTHDPLVGNQYSNLDNTTKIFRQPLGEPMTQAPKIFDDAIEQGHALAGVNGVKPDTASRVAAIAANHPLGRPLPYLMGESLAGGALFAAKELMPNMENVVGKILPAITLMGSPKLATGVGKALYGQYGWQKGLSKAATRAAAVADTPMGKWISGAGQDMSNKAARQLIMRQISGQNDQQNQ